MRPELVIGVLIGAFWASWRWLLQRTWMTPDEAITLVVMILVVVVGVGWRVWRGGRLAPVPLRPPAAALAVYALTLGIVPAILSAAIAVTTTLATLYAAGHHRRPPIAFWGLCCLVLPVVPTLQFYFGYPMRVVSAVLTVPLLQLNGLEVSLSGTALIWNGQLIQFDAPCSGVTMAWAGMLLVFTVATLHAYDWRGLVRMSFLGLRLLLLANVLRAASLFYLETGLLPWNSEPLHQAVGLAAFAMAMLCMLARMRRLAPCPA